MTDLAWAAGLFEGEGCITTNLCNGGRNLYWNCAVKSNDEDVLRRFASVTGVGRVYGPYEQKGSQPHWRWQLCKQHDVQDFLHSILPFLGKRRTARASEALEALQVKFDG